jgi:hypothetical protein
MGAAGDSTPILADHDGFTEAFYHLLWAKNFNGEPCPEVLVPDTIIYKYRIPAYWYFTGGDGRLKRKAKANIKNELILKSFCAAARSDKDVVAMHICEHPLDGVEPPEGTEEPPAATQTVVRYFDKAGLRDFLFKEEKSNDGCLQKFVRPKGLFNSMIQAAWSPQMCLLERRVNLCPLLSGRASLQERCCTYEGSEHLSQIAPVRGTLLADRVQHLCQELVSHIAATSYLKQKITRMLLNFKTDVEDNVWFLWCASVRVGGSGDDPASSLGAAPAAAAKRSSDATLSAASMRSSASASQLAPVCLNPATTSPMRAPLPKHLRATESVCPFTGKSLTSHTPYFVTYKTLLEYCAMLDARMRVRRGPTEVPPLLLTVCPDLDGERYYREVSNPLSLFLYTRVLVSEEAYLEFSAAAMPGVRVLPGIQGRARKKMLLTNSASAPVLAGPFGGSKPLPSITPS